MDRGSTASAKGQKQVAHSIMAAQMGMQSTFTRKASGRKTCPTRMMVQPGRGIVGADMAEAFAAGGEQFSTCLR